MSRPRHSPSFWNLLDHERVHVNQADLEQVQRQHQYLLVFEFVAGKFSSLPHRIKLFALFQFSMTLSPSWISLRKGFLSEIVTQEDGCCF